jgi:membrane protease YdiL (CAAX protease family)
MVSLNQPRSPRIYVGILMAFILWYFVFLTDLLVSFWYRVTIAAIILATYAYFSDEKKAQVKIPTGKDLVWGIISGILLYALFFIGYQVFKPFVEAGALNVYEIRNEVSLILPAFVLLITSFCEEYFWREYIQSNLVTSLDNFSVLVTSVLYAAIHIPTLNLPLVFAALIAGLTWGILYKYTDSIWVVTFSHIIWTEMIFVFLPLK